ncbi:MAG TPA: ankyrin repeat domain-containing protein [Armatimonadota bacterium]|jgi:ankyrin repeat protein
MLRWYTRAMMVVTLLALLAANDRICSAAPNKALMGADLFIAIREHDHAAVQSLLGRGADPNLRNWLGITPLMWSALKGDLAACKSLVARRADIQAGSPFGNALTVASVSGSQDVALWLLSRGARVDAERSDRMTALMAASSSGLDPVVRLILARGAEVNAQDVEGMTALMQAARRGRPGILQQLLNRGARVNQADNRGWTALTYAAANGQTDCVRLLLSRGARADVRDRQGRDLARIAARYSRDPRVLNLLPAGSVRATKQAPLVRLASAGTTSAGSVPTSATVSQVARGPQQAVEAGLKAVQRGTATFSKHAPCVSCHHQGLGLMLTGLAQDRGFAIDAALAKSQTEVVRKGVGELTPLLETAVHNPEAAKLVPAVDIGDIPPTFGYVLGGMAAHHEQPDRLLTLCSDLLAKQQRPDGSFHYGFTRGPIESSYFTVTALALKVLKSYPTTSPEEDARRIARAREWLLKTPAATTDERAGKLLGLAYSGADETALDQAAEAVLAGQHADGGWSQFQGKPSDAYATGFSLYALSQGGVQTSSPAYQRGVQYLLKTQEPDGSWYVSKWAIPVNFYFHADFPHGESQYISYGATCWATMALIMASPHPVRQARTQ